LEWALVSTVEVGGSANSSNPLREPSNVRLRHQVSQLLKRHTGVNVQGTSDILQQRQHGGHCSLREQIDL
jgi:hypothetical protein